MISNGILLAAGTSARMGSDKLTLDLGGTTPLALSLDAMARAGLTRILITVSAATRAHAETLAASCPVPCALVEGGSTRQESVLLALRQCHDADIVVIHDAARCRMAPRLIRESVAAAAAHGSGIAALPVRDTLRGDGSAAVPRDGLLAMQTPQAFQYPALLAAYEQAAQEGWTATDDCDLYLRAGNTPRYIPGDLWNQKLTYPEDLPFFRIPSLPRIGCGQDIHRLVPGRALVLGGVHIPFELGLLGHSDADVLTHAVIDALLGAAALGDIGRLFPETDEAYRDADSIGLLERVGMLLAERNLRIGNIDATVIAERPRLSGYIPAMEARIAAALGLEQSQVSVKAKTAEGLGPEGNLSAISARCVALVY